MAMDDHIGVFGLEPGCPIHGDDHMRECGMCGTEFCRVCFPRSAVCPDCADQKEDDAEEEDPDFEDVKKVDDVLNEDAEADKLVSEEDEDEGRE